jgi:hypothetical protein
MKVRRVFVTVFVLVLMFSAIFVAERSAYAIYADQGDVIVYGFEVAEYGDPSYTSQQIYLGFEHMAIQSGIYNPFFGWALPTWDDRNTTTGGAPTEKKYVWQHVEIQMEDGDVVEYDVDMIAILKPNTNMRNAVNIDVMVDLYKEFRHQQDVTGYSVYNQPLGFAFRKWAEAVYHYSEGYSWLEKARGIWTHYYGTDPASPPPYDRSQFYLTNDIEDPNFVYRSGDCSSMTAWSILAGVNDKAPGYRDLFLGSQRAVDAIDCLTPGQVAFFMCNAGWVDVELHSR